MGQNSGGARITRSTVKLSQLLTNNAGDNALRVRPAVTVDPAIARSGPVARCQRDVRRSCGLARLGLPANQDTLRWTHASSTWVRDHFRLVLEAVNTDGQPLLITRRGHCGLNASGPPSV